MLFILNCMKKEDFHIDMSGRISRRRNIGIACVSIDSREHNGCALKGNLIKFIQKNLFLGSIYEERSKLYAICIYLLIKNKVDNINTLIVCNDEDFTYVKEYLILLMNGKIPFNIINITELRNKLGKKVKSLAHNFAKCYRKKALKRHKWEKGKELNVVEINYRLIKTYWDLIKR